MTDDNSRLSRRSLIGLATSAAAAAMLPGAAVASVFAHERVVMREISLNTVIDFLCSEFLMSREQLLTAIDPVLVPNAREYGIYLAYELTTRSLTGIGRAFGGIEREAVIEIVRRMQALREKGGMVAANIEFFTEEIVREMEAQPHLSFSEIHFS